MSKNYCDKCEGTYRSKVALEEANDWLHGIREVFVFDELQAWAFKEGYCIMEVSVTNNTATFRRDKKVYRKFKASYARHGEDGLKWTMKSADNIDELYSKVMGNGSDNDEDLL